MKSDVGFDFFNRKIQNQHLLSDINVSKDGLYAAFTVKSPIKSSNETETNVWLSFKKSMPAPLSRLSENHSISLPRWSPSGDQLAVAMQGHVSSGYTSIGIYSAPLFNFKEIATIPGSIEDLFWMPENLSILALVAETGSDSVVTSGSQRSASLEDIDLPVTTRIDSGKRHLCEINFDSKEPYFFGPKEGTIWEFENFDENSIAAIWSNDVTESGWYDSSVVFVDRHSGDIKTFYKPSWQISSITKNPLKNQIALVEGWASDRGTVCGEIKVIEIASGEVLTIKSFGVDVSKVRWRSRDSVWFTGWQNLSGAWGWVKIDGEVGELHLDDLQASSTNFQSSPENTVLDQAIWSISAPREFESPEIIVGASGSKLTQWKRISKFGLENQEKVPNFKTDLLRWSSSDGRKIEGLLVYDPNSRAQLSPLVIYIHGGPASLWTYSLRPEVLLLLSAGYAVLLPNPRGSVGRGQEFARANLGDASGAEVADIILGIAECAKYIAIDESKVSVVGGSYGGYLAACAATMTDQIRCAVVMYGHPNLLSARFGSNNPAFYDKLMKGAPTLANSHEYLMRSPLMRVSSSSAPTLILHGKEDRCCPVSQAEEFYRAFIDKGVSSELIIFPGEGHGLHGSLAKSECWVQILSWLDKHSDTVNV
ncbi:MAG: alpha/beta fold hydrolase [Actinomycetes bacterium]